MTLVNTWEDLGPIHLYFLTDKGTELNNKKVG